MEVKNQSEKTRLRRYKSAHLDRGKSNRYYCLLYSSSDNGTSSMYEEDSKKFKKDKQYRLSEKLKKLMKANTRCYHLVKGYGKKKVA